MTDLVNVTNNTALATVDLGSMLKDSSEIIKNLLPSQLDFVISTLGPLQTKAISELKAGESIRVRVLRPKTWSELTSWSDANSPIEDTLLITSPQLIKDDTQ